MNLISAISLNGVIGNKNTNALPWGNKYHEDMQFFRKMTANKTVVMGRNTFESIGRLLPNRRNIILSRKDYKAEGAEVYPSLKEAVKILMRDNEYCSDVWIIGGSYVYQEALKYVHKLYLTTIPEIIYEESSIYFPYVNPDRFELETYRIELSKDKNLYCNIFTSKSLLANSIEFSST